jgi:peptidoglycan/xylan/chitin deacetylase (PgdA/CDA1 family)
MRKVCMGASTHNEMGTPRMTWEQIKALSAEGFSFGSHTCLHSRLPDLNDEQPRKELIASKKKVFKLGWERKSYT